MGDHKPRSGRKRTLAVGDDIAVCCSVLPHAGIAKLASGNANKQARKAVAADEEFKQTTTARYGHLFKTVGGSAQEEGATPILYTDPFALLEVFCTHSVAFARFLGWCVEEARPYDPRVVLYVDDVRPGDVHRPGFNRLFCAAY